MGKALTRRLKAGGYSVAIALALIGPLLTATPVHADTRYEAGFSTSGTLLGMTDKELDSRLIDMQHLGATWIRIDFTWPTIQPTSPNTYNWAKYDRIVRVAGVHHLKILAVLDYTPTWAADYRCKILVITVAAGHKCNPGDNDTFARFTRAAAIRYKGLSVRGWEIWNEPNNSSLWKTVQPNNAVWTEVASYAALANATAYQIRQNDPDSLVITGGLGPEFNPVYPKGISQGKFLAQMLPLLNPSLFDGIGIHPYSWPTLPSTAAIYNAFYTVNNGPPDYDLRTIIANAGWGDKQLWGTEFGAPTTGVSNVVVPTATARPDHVSEAVQAQIISQGMSNWYKIPNVGPLFIHADSDEWLPQIKNEGGFGLRRVDGSEKPSYAVFEAAVKKLGN